MESPGAGMQGFCKACDYPLRGVAGNRCPECGREFDPGDARTFSARPRRARRRRLVVRIAIPVVMLAMFGVLFPRGYVIGTIGFSCSCGETLRATRAQFIAPSWLPTSYPYWTTLPKAASQGHAHAWVFNVAGSRSVYTWNLGTRAGGGLGASGNSMPNAPGTINGVAATPENARAVLESVVGGMAKTSAFGVNVRGAGMGSGGGGVGMPTIPAPTNR